MLKRLLTMIRKELLQVFRNRITLVLTIVSPVIQLLVFGYVAVIDVKDIPTAVLDHSNSPLSRRLLSDFTNSGYFTIARVLESESEIGPLLDGGQVDLVLVIPKDFHRKISTGEVTEIMGALDGSDSNSAITVGNYFSGVAMRFAVSVTTQLIAGRLAVEFKPPFEPRPRVFFNPQMETVYFLVPGIIAVLVMMLLVVLSAISIVRERERGTFEQLLVTPIRTTEMVLGKTIPFALMGYVTIFLITIVGTQWFRVPIRGDFGLLMLLSGLYMFTALGLGMLVSSVAQTQQQALMLGMFLVIPQILLSGFIFPIESMPEIMQWFTYVIPARYFLVIIRGIFLKGIGFAELLPQIAALTLFAVVIFTVAIIRFSRRLEI